eukprot:scaffold879_cov410-Prasinococcus_capsulatus_cf.AAC.27
MDGWLDGWMNGWRCRGEKDRRDGAAGTARGCHTHTRAHIYIYMKRCRGTGRVATETGRGAGHVTCTCGTTAPLRGWAASADFPEPRTQPDIGRAWRDRAR